MMTGPLSWMERLWSSIADRGRFYADVLQPSSPKTALDHARDYALALVSQRGEASGAAIARELVALLAQLPPDSELSFYKFVAEEFNPPPAVLRAAAEAYLQDSTPKHASQLAIAAEPMRQELLRRMNMAPGGTAALVAMRKTLLSQLRAEPGLQPLNSDLRHLFASWFNRGFLELRRISWHTPAAILEKLIAYEAVHAIEGWDDLRRRLGPDRRCFGFFHPALPDEPLIFVEVALTTGLASSVQPLLHRESDTVAQKNTNDSADTAIFYSISNCQEGLRGVSFGNFLIKQVVEELKAELPRLNGFATLSPVPGFRRWLETHLQGTETAPVLSEDESLDLKAALDCQGAEIRSMFAATLATDAWLENPVLTDALRHPLLRLCSTYLVTLSGQKGPTDPVARFHLTNGARLERVNWLGNTAPRGIMESYGIMVNYLYEPDQIEANHEALVRGSVVRSPDVDDILGRPFLSSKAASASAGRKRRL